MYAPAIDESTRPNTISDLTTGHLDMSLTIDEFDYWALPDSPARLCGPCWCAGDPDNET
jgi:hypothetical protein